MLSPCRNSGGGGQDHRQQPACGETYELGRSMHFLRSPRCVEAAQQACIGGYDHHYPDLLVWPEAARFDLQYVRPSRKDWEQTLPLVVAGCGLFGRVARIVKNNCCAGAPLGSRTGPDTPPTSAPPRWGKTKSTTNPHETGLIASILVFIPVLPASFLFFICSQQPSSATHGMRSTRSPTRSVVDDPVHARSVSPVLFLPRGGNIVAEYARELGRRHRHWLC